MAQHIFNVYLLMSTSLNELNCFSDIRVGNSEQI